MNGCYSVYTLPMDKVAQYAAKEPTQSVEGRTLLIDDAKWIQPQGHAASRLNAPLLIGVDPIGVAVAGRLNGQYAQIAVDPGEVSALEVKQRTSGARAGVATAITLGCLTPLAIMMTVLGVSLGLRQPCTQGRAC